MPSGHALGRDILGVLSLRRGTCPEADLRALLTRLRGGAPGAGYRMTLHRLRRDRLVVRRGREPESTLHLSRAGFLKAGLPPVASAALPAPDGTVYFATYDVPVRLNAVRDQFRAALRRHGWSRLHKSLWISERDVRDAAAGAAERLGIEPYVFLGIGALVKPVLRAKPEGFAEEVRSAARGIVRESVRDLPTAYRRWADLTGRLREPSAAAHLSRDLRAAWSAATRSLRQAVR